MRNVYIVLISLLAAAACRVPQKLVLQPQTDESISSIFKSDSINSAKLGYQTFIADKELRNIIDTVLAYNPDLRNAIQRMEYARAQSRISNAYLYPQVNLFPQSSLRKFGLYTMDGAGNIVTDMEKGKLVPVHLPDFYFGAQSSWEIDLWSKLKNRRKADYARFLASSETKNLIQTGLIAEVARLYYEWKAAQQNKTLLEETIALQSEVVELAKIQKEAGQITELAVQQFFAQFKNFEGMLESVDLEMINIETALNILVGKKIKQDILDVSKNALQALPNVYAGLAYDLIQNRPDLRQAEWILKASNYDVASARAAFYPSLLLNSMVGLQAYRTGLLFNLPTSLAYSVIGGFAGPVFNRGIIKAEYSKATAMQQEALNNYESTLNKSLLEVSQQIKTIEQLKEMFDAKEIEASTLKKSIETATDLFKTGRANYLDILLARQNALRANMELIDIKKEQFIARINFYRALGGGWR
jgi:multidrug efflux system outer membrane protein